MNIYILKNYNNYYNRMFKRESTIDAYEDAVGEFEYTLADANFTPNDGVNTDYVIGTYDYSGLGDYLIVTERKRVPGVVVRFEEKIISRWFIIDSVRTRAGQYQLTLRRDLVADYYDDLLQSPMLIEKALLNDNDPLILNSENSLVNQIKQSETLLTDDSKCAWLVGYLAQNYLRPTEEEPTPKSKKIEFKAVYSPTITVASREDWEYSQYIDSGIYKTAIYKQLTFKAKSLNDGKNWFFSYNPSQGYWDYSETDDTGSDITYTTTLTGGDLVDELNVFTYNSSTTDKQKIAQAMDMYITDPQSYITQSQYADLALLNGKTIQIEDETPGLYAISFSRASGTSRYSFTGDILENKYIPTYFWKGLLRQWGTGNPTYKVEVRSVWATLNLRVLQLGDYEITMPTYNSRLHTVDAPYDMFCIPYNVNDVKIRSENANVSDVGFSDYEESLVPQAAITVASAIATQLGQNLLDIQLLPYCPLQNYTFDEQANRLTIDCDDFLSYTKIYSVTTSGDAQAKSIEGYIYWVTNCSGEKTINQTIETDGNRKMTNECDMWRLCSPNYNGQFQFNAAKMSEPITTFNIDYTYLPYSPYIHINPQFSGLYGQDFNDARGLICQGDFSISYASDQWVNYQVANKNYANTFNRQLDNLELRQDVERGQQITNAVLGTISAAAGGAAMGAKGGAGGAVAGGLVAAGLSAAGASQDWYYAEKLRNETHEYMQDMYKLQLGNIQAMPQSLQKVTAYTNNNKIFPVLEHYSCTPEEKIAVANKIAYTGMTVGKIGTLNEVVSNQWSYKVGTESIKAKNFIKGKLIRFISKEGNGEDFHLVNSLAEEMNKGMYFPAKDKRPRPH